MGEDGRAIALDMLVEPDAGAGFGYDGCERHIADLKRIAPQVVAAQLDQIEGLPQGQRSRTTIAVTPVHRSKSGLLMSGHGQNAKNSH
jgi:hypothetical protein